MKINHDKIISKLETLEKKYSNVKINSKIIESMTDSLVNYPGVLPLHIFEYCPPKFNPIRLRDIDYLDNLQYAGLFEELYWELDEERHVSNMGTHDQLDGTIVEWVDKLQNHPELLSDAEREWVKNNPEYKKIIIKD